MYKKEYTQQAFPVSVGEQDALHEGMTLLDYFAAKALQGCLAYSHYNESWGDYHNSGKVEDVAEISYRYAAAMMEERKKYLQA